MYQRFILVLFTALLLNSYSHAQEIGLQLNSLKSELEKDVPATMKKVKEMGFTHIQFSTTYGLTFPEFIKTLAINNLSVLSFETDFTRLEKFAQSAVDEARSYGARYIVCSWNPHENGTFTKEDVDRAAAVLNAAGKTIARNGLLLCYQPSGDEFQPYGGGTLFDYFVQQLDLRVVHFEMDVFQIKQAGQDPVSLLKKYPTRFIMIGLKDRKKGAGTGIRDQESNVALGKGDVGIAEIVKTAREFGIQHFFIKDESPRAEEQIPKSLQYLKSVM